MNGPMDKKLRLNKFTIARLNEAEMMRLRGGESAFSCIDPCNSSGTTTTLSVNATEYCETNQFSCACPTVASECFQE